MNKPSHITNVTCRHNNVIRDILGCSYKCKDCGEYVPEFAHRTRKTKQVNGPNTQINDSRNTATNTPPGEGDTQNPTIRETPGETLRETLPTGARQSSPCTSTTAGGPIKNTPPYAPENRACFFNAHTGAGARGYIYRSCFNPLTDVTDLGKTMQNKTFVRLMGFQQNLIGSAPGAISHLAKLYSEN